MSSVAEGARHVGARSRRHADARRRSSSRLLAGGVVWIAAFGLLLAGVVAVNVTVLRLNLQLDQVDRQRSELKADIASLRSELSSAAATARIERLAQNELGLVRADPESIIFVELPR